MMDFDKNAVLSRIDRMAKKVYRGNRNAVYMFINDLEEHTGTLDDYGLMEPEKQLNDTDATPNINIKKPFKSRYVDDKGAWTYTSVDEGYVDFGDYIKDKRENC